MNLSDIECPKCADPALLEPVLSYGGKVIGLLCRLCGASLGVGRCTGCHNTGPGRDGVVLRATDQRGRAYCTDTCKRRSLRRGVR